MAFRLSDFQKSYRELQPTMQLFLSRELLKTRISKHSLSSTPKPPELLILAFTNCL